MKARHSTTVGCTRFQNLRREKEKEGNSVFIYRSVLGSCCFDTGQNAELRGDGWNVIRVEHQVLCKTVKWVCTL